MQPAALVFRAVNVGSCNLRSLNRQLLSNGYYRYTAHNMDTELQAFTVQVISQGLKAFATCRRRKTIHRWLKTSERINDIIRICFIVSMSLIVSYIPTDIYYNVLPSVLL